MEEKLNTPVFKRFKNILKSYLIEGSLSDLEKRWNEPHRYYHNINHLTNIIKDIEQNVLFNDLSVIDKHVILIAAFYHDAIYNPKRSTNEEESQRLFAKQYKGDNMYFFNTVIKLIECTKFRKRPFATIERIFWDADNKSLTKDINTLNKDESLIRKEYKNILYFT